MSGGSVSGAGSSPAPGTAFRRAVVYRSPAAAMRARVAFFAFRSEVMMSSVLRREIPRSPGWLDEVTKARVRRESVALVLKASRSAWAAAARSQACATATVTIHRVDRPGKPWGWPWRPGGDDQYRADRNMTWNRRYQRIDVAKDGS